MAAATEITVTPILTPIDMPSSFGSPTVVMGYWYRNLHPKWLYRNTSISIFELISLILLSNQLMLWNHIKVIGVNFKIIPVPNSIFRWEIFQPIYHFWVKPGPLLILMGLNIEVQQSIFSLSLKKTSKRRTWAFDCNPEVKVVFFTVWCKEPETNNKCPVCVHDRRFRASTGQCCL